MIQYGSADILMRVIREEVRRKQLRIQDLAKLMKVSEPTMKRYLAGKGVTLEVWTKLYEILDLNIRQVAERAGDIMVYQKTFTEKQELTFCKVPGLYAFFIQLTMNFTAKEIMAKFKLTEKSVFFYLKTLDDIGLIKWKGGLEFKANFSGEPNWRKGGPLSKKNKDTKFNEFVIGNRNSEHWRMGGYHLTLEDLDLVRQQASSVLTVAWRAEQRTNHLKRGRRPVSICILAEEYAPDFEHVIPNV